MRWAVFFVHFDEGFWGKKSLCILTIDKVFGGPLTDDAARISL